MLNWSWLPRPIHCKDDRPIFITGAPRCGSSWVGEVFSTCNDARYIYEPFNHKWAPSLHGHLAHFSYLSDDASPFLTKYTQNILQGRQSWKQVSRSVYRGYFKSATRAAKKVIIKDPTASLMTNWLSEEFNAQVLFVLRHPCGFASSLEMLDWKLNTNRLLRQTELMRDYLEPFTDVLRSAKKDKWLTRGAFWGALHHVFRQQLITHTDWHICKYEDLCKDPIEQFPSLAKKLGLELNDQTRQKVKELSNKVSTDPGSTRRHSHTMPEIWKERMSQGEIDSVMGIVDEFGLDYY